MKTNRINKHTRFVLYFTTLFLATLLFMPGPMAGFSPVSAKERTEVSTKKKLVAEMKKEKAATIYFSTDKEMKLNIPAQGNSGNKTLVIDAPNATVVNKASFKSITVNAASSYTEKQSGNSISLKDADIDFSLSKGQNVSKLTVYSKMGSVRLQKKAKAAEMLFKNASGYITLEAASGSKVDITLIKKCTLEITGTGSTDIHITVKSKDSRVKTHIPVTIDAEKATELAMEEGSEGTVLNLLNKATAHLVNNNGIIPVIKGNGVITNSGTEPDDVNTSGDDSDAYLGNYFVTQFADADGQLCFAVDEKTEGFISVYKTSDSEFTQDTVLLKKEHSILGGVICDDSGYYYAVTGENNESHDKTVKTIFVTKYDSMGNVVKSAGFADGAKNQFYNRMCSLAINNGVLAINYACTFYTFGEGSAEGNALLAINTESIEKVSIPMYGTSGSKGVQAVPSENGFAFVSLGTMYPRAFTIEQSYLSDYYYTPTWITSTANIFHFGLTEGGEKDDAAVYETNSDLGGIAVLPKNRIVLIGKSAKELSGEAYGSSKELFIQIYMPFSDEYTEFPGKGDGFIRYYGLRDDYSFITRGERVGKTYSGDEPELNFYQGWHDVTDYGVKWLTSYGSDYIISTVKMAKTSDNNTVVLYELYNISGDQRVYKGLYYIVIDQYGNVLLDSELYDENSYLNIYGELVYKNGKIYWVGKKRGMGDRLNVYSLDINGSLKAKGKSKEQPQKLIPISSDSFPDESFRSYVSEVFDFNEDGNLDEEEIKSARKISGTLINGTRSFTDLKGIEYFTELEYLNLNDCDRLSSIDLSSNKKLKRLEFNNSGSDGMSGITSLDLSANYELEYLDISHGIFDFVNLSSNTKLAYLDCSYNKLTGLDLSGCRELEYLNCAGNQITDLKLGNGNKLNYINCSYNEIASLDVSRYIGLETLNCNHNSIDALNVSDSPLLKVLECSHNKISSLKVDNNVFLEELDCWGNQIAELTVNKNTALVELYCSDNKLNALDLSSNTELAKLGCGGNDFLSLDISRNTKLEWLNLEDSKFTYLDISHNPLLTNVNCNGSKQLSGINFGNAPALTELYIISCNFGAGSLDISGCSSLKILCCGNNGLSSLDVSININLEKLHCDSNKLTAFDLSHNTALRDLDLRGNKLTYLDITGLNLVTFLPDEGITVKNGSETYTFYYNDLR